MKDYPFSKNRRWYCTKGRQSLGMKEPRGMASRRSRRREAQNSGRGARQVKECTSKIGNKNNKNAFCNVKCKIGPVLPHSTFQLHGKNKDFLLTSV